MQASLRARCRGLDLVAVAVLPSPWDHKEISWRDEETIQWIVSPDNGHAVELDRPDVLKKRLDWFDGQLDLDPDKLVFIPLGPF